MTRTQHPTILEAELLRWGMVFRNAEYFTSPASFFEWYGGMLDELRRAPAINSDSRVGCYLSICDYTNARPQQRGDLGVNVVAPTVFA